MGRNRIWIPEAFSPVTESIIHLPPVRLGGYYTVDLVESKTGKVKQHLEFPNLITNAGLDLIGSGVNLNGVYSLLAVGTGNSTPAVTDTALDNELTPSVNNGGISDVDTTQSSPREYSSRKRTRVFTEAQANGDLTELGWRVGSTLCNRALFADLQGNPTIVYKTSNDILKITYEYRIFAPQGDMSGAFDLGVGSGSTSYIIRPQNVNNALGWGSLRSNLGSLSSSLARIHSTAILGSRTGDNSPTPYSGSTSHSYGGYVSGNYYRDMEYIWTFSGGDFIPVGGVRLITWNPWYASGDSPTWQMYLSASLAKTSLTKFTIKFRHTWNRV